MNKMHKIHRFTFFDFIILLIMIFVVIVTLYPILLIVAGSFSDPNLVTQRKIGIIPKQVTLSTYKMVLSQNGIWLAYWNTIKYTVVGTFLATAITLSTAYPLSKSHFVGRKVFNRILAFTMVFSGGLIPTFLVVKALGWIDTIWAVTIPGFAAAWYVILARTFFESIPKSLEESAKIDGANDFTILMKIYIPLSLPIVATLILFYAVANWNSFFLPLIYLNDQKAYPLSLLMRKILIQGDMAEYAGANAASKSPIAIKYANIIVTTLPIILIYPFIQKYFAQGMMVGAVKG